MLSWGGLGARLEGILEVLAWVVLDWGIWSCLGCQPGGPSLGSARLGYMELPGGSAWGV